MKREAYDDLVEAVYDSAFSADQWSGAISAIGAAFKSPAVALFVQTTDQQYGGGITEGIENSFIDLYEERFANENPWFAIPNLMRPGNVVTDLTLEKIHSDKKAFYHSEYCQDWFLPQGFRHSMGANLVDSQKNLINFTFNRPQKLGYYSKREIAEFKSLVSHLSRAVEINSRLHYFDICHSSSEQVLNTLRIGVLGLGVSGRIEYMNGYARKLIYGDQGLFEHCSIIRAQDNFSSQLLSAAIDQAYRYNKSTTVVIKRLLKTSLSVSVIPANEVRGFLGIEKKFVTLFITDPDDRDIGDAEYLENRWNLTPVEAKFAHHLLGGLSISDIAEVMALTQNTARWYSKQIMRKLDVNRQSDLIIKLMRDLSVIVRPY